MEIEQSFSVPFASDVVWRCFHDTEGIVTCLPGAALTAPPQGEQLQLSMTVKLGPIVAAFAGEGEMTLDDALLQGSVSGSGSDRKSGSRVKGEAAFSLHDDDTGAISTRVDVRVNFSITGSLAQFSRAGIVRDLAERMTAAFSENLKKKLESETIPITQTIKPDVHHSTESIGMDAAPAAHRAPLPVAAPLELGGLFWQILRDRLRRLFKFSPKKR